MTEPDDETIRRWQQYTSTPPPAEPDSPPPVAEVGPPPALPLRNGFSARRMTILGLAFFAVLGLVAALFSWPTSGSAGHPTTTDPRPGQTVDGAKGSRATNLVVPPGDLREAQGTVISGVEWLPGHEPEMMIDGRMGTSWQALGNQSGHGIRFELGDVHRIAKVAIAIPGGQARPVTRVTWTFLDTGVTVTQDLTAGETGLQTVAVPDATTNVVILTLSRVGGPPSIEGDFTGISEVQIVGY